MWIPEKWSMSSTVEVMLCKLTKHLYRVKFTLFPDSKGGKNISGSFRGAKITWCIVQTHSRYERDKMSIDDDIIADDYNLHFLPENFRKLRATWKIVETLTRRTRERKAILSVISVQCFHLELLSMGSSYIFRYNLNIKSFIPSEIETYGP